MAVTPCCSPWDLPCRVSTPFPVCTPEEETAIAAGPAFATSPFSGVRIGDRFFGLCNGPLTMTAWLTGYEYECAQDIDAQGVTNALNRPTRVKIRPTGVIQTYYPGGGPAMTGRAGIEPRMEAVAAIAAREAEERRARNIRYATYAGGALLVGGLIYYATKGA